MVNHFSKTGISANFFHACIVQMACAVVTTKPVAVSRMQDRWNIMLKQTLQVSPATSHLNVALRYGK